jgi:hypothetical protein
VFAAGVSMWRCAWASSMSLAPETGPAIDPSTYLHHDRDVRIDFFRGVALLFIFIDHIPRNFLAFFTLHNFGFSDAAEMFVGLAGYAAFFAYTKPFERKGLLAGLRKVGQRVREIYLSHLLVLAVCLSLLAVAAWIFYNPLFTEHENLDALRTDPSGILLSALFLVYQPGYHDILPLYIILLAWFPILLWLLRRHVLLALGVSAAVWAAANFGRWNLPSLTQSEGWVFNPFAWQFLFSIGVVAAYLRNDAWRADSRVLFWLCVAYVVFALVIVAPWTKIPGLAEARLLPAELVLPITKRNLSVWRIAHFIALAYLAVSLIPQDAGWLSQAWAQRLIDAGRHSLPVFCLGIVLSLAAFVVLRQAGQDGISQLFAQALVNGLGVAILGLTAWKLAQLKTVRTRSGPASHSRVYLRSHR